MRSKEVEDSIETLKSWLDYNKKHKNMLLKADEIIEVQENILSYISELEEEIDELKEHIRKRIAYTQDLEKDLFENCENYVISKDKIRAKIKELEAMSISQDIYYQDVLKVFEELLGE